MPRTISWWSAGAASTIATKLVLKDCADAIPVYCDPGAEHDDNVRFRSDCEAWFGVPIVVIRSDVYRDTWDVWEKVRYLAGIDGARCTVELKVVPRLSFQRPDDVHVFGYTADGPDVARANRMRETYPEMTIRTPLINEGLTKAGCLDLIRRSGIALPPMYAVGFSNNNSLPCVKATSPDYWSLVRKEFPDRFNRMAKLSRDLGVRLCRLDGERAFIDEIPSDWPTTKPIVPSCDFLCHIASSDL
jgi:hypothetical protein